MPEEVLHCPLCASERSRFFDRREFRGQIVTNRVCLDCGLVFESPRMTETESAAFYANEYRVVYEGTADPTARNTADQRGRADSLLAFTRPLLPAVRRYLDIGCSFGLLLQTFQKAYGCQPVGIEPGDGHRQAAAQAGLTVYAGLAELEQQTPERFDLISLAHVLEHLPEPVAYLAHLREALLAPSGRLLVEVPNLYAHDSFEIAHLVSYSRHSLIQTLAQAGYEVVKLERHGRPRSAVLPLYLTVLARPAVARAGLHPERGVALKRRLGLLRRRILERLVPHKAWLSN